MNQQAGGVSVQGQEKTDASAQPVRQRKHIFLSLSRCSIQVFSGSDNAHSHWGGQFALFSLLNKIQIQKYPFEFIQMETLSQTHPEIMFNLITKNPLPSQIGT